MHLCNGHDTESFFGQYSQRPIEFDCIVNIQHESLKYINAESQIQTESKVQEHPLVSFREAIRKQPTSYIPDS